MRHTESDADVLGGARVLIVDDNFLIAADLDLMVEDAGGQTVALAGSSEQALRVLSDQRIDAVLLEFKLREGHADAVLRALTRHRLPCVVYTGAALGSEFERRYPDATVVEKPALPEVLVEALATALKDCRLAAA